jgi:hypothetical protein
MVVQGGRRDEKGEVGDVIRRQGHDPPVHLALTDPVGGSLSLEFG